MRILNRYPFTLFFLTTFLVAEAQKSKENGGFIITLQNDTVTCTFKQKNWKKHPSSIGVNYNGKDTIFSPDAINGFVVTSQLQYVSRQVQLTNYADKIQDATTSRISEMAAAQKFFLKTLYKGTFTLYVVPDKLNRKHFFAEGPGNLVELYSHYYIQLPQENRPYDSPITIPDRSYEFVLKTLMTPCRSLFNIIENISLEEDQLIQVFKMYDKCLESKKED